MKKTNKFKGKTKETDETLAEISRKLSGRLCGVEGRRRSPEVNQKRSEAMKRHFKDPSYRRRVALANARAHKRKPTKPEIVLGELLDKTFPNEWRYVGDGQVVIGYNCPDFININGKKLLIELFGDYWHRNDDPQKWIKRYRKFGFGCLVIWEHELREPEAVIRRVETFVRGNY